MISLTARLNPSAADARRGVVRLHPEVLDALGLRPWDAVRLTGSRGSTAIAAAASNAAVGVALVDDVTLSNIGLRENAEVVVAPVEVKPARSVTVAGSKLASALRPETVRLALTGKVITQGDAVSLLPQDVAPAPGADPSSTRSQVSALLGASWTSELITISAVEPEGVVAVVPSTVVHWRGTAEAPSTPEPLVQAETQPSVPVADLLSAQQAARTLTEWFEITFRQPELLAALGTSARLGVLVSGPEGVGKTTLVRSVAASVGAKLYELAGPELAALEPGSCMEKLRATVDAARADQPAVVLITDADSLVPATDPPPVATMIIQHLRESIRDGAVAVVLTSAHGESLDPRVRDSAIIDRELTLPLPDQKLRGDLLRLLLKEVPLGSDVELDAIADRTPGFAVADLAALCREAAVRAAVRQRDVSAPRIWRQDLDGAAETVRPVSMSTSDTLSTGGLTLADVGDMTEVKQALTEAALWPLQYPDSFARLGVQPPRGVLLYGPPGCGKTFLVRALAGTGKLNVLSVKGAELMDKWVGESERAVRELFARARDAAPTLVFLDEIDALAPRRGQSGDSGVSDRVVAALLTELDGVEPLRDVVILGATNRPELVDPALLRPGRLERLVYVPPPDADARAEILRAAARNTPLAPDVDLDEVASTVDGYSAADCAALIREAALTAMRADITAAQVSAADLSTARENIRPSLDPLQLAELQAFADRN